MAAGDIGDARLVHQADEVPLHFFGKVVVLLLPVVPEDRLEHILRIGISAKIKLSQLREK